MANDTVFTNKEKAFIAVSASVAAGCQPCTEYHVNGARRAGACDRSIGLAIETALAVRESATQNIQAWADRCAGPRPELDQEFRNEKRWIAGLAAVASAAAVNSVPDLLARIENARLAGVTQEQIAAAVAVATSIRATAVQKVEAALGGPTESVNACCGSASAETRDAGAGKQAGCGCGQ